MRDGVGVKVEKWPHQGSNLRPPAFMDRCSTTWAIRPVVLWSWISYMYMSKTNLGCSWHFVTQAQPSCRPVIKMQLQPQLASVQFTATLTHLPGDIIIMLKWKEYYVVFWHIYQSDLLSAYGSSLGIQRGSDCTP